MFENFIMRKFKNQIARVPCYSLRFKTFAEILHYSLNFKKRNKNILTVACTFWPEPSQPVPPTSSLAIYNPPLGVLPCTTPALAAPPFIVPEEVML